MDEIMEPGISEYRAYRFARNAAYEYEHYGFPYPGTVRDQPMYWRLAVDCVRDAENEGRAQASADAQEQSRKEMEQAEY